jgi:hypothetical protein
MAYPGYQPPNRTNVGPPSKSKDQIARELDVARGRREFFSDRPDVSDDRALKRMKQFDEMRSFKNKLIDSGRVLKGVRPDGTEYIVKNKNTGEPVYLGTTPKFDTDPSSPTFGRYTSTSVADKEKQLANLYGPTFREIGSDIGYGLGSIAKGFAEKGTPLISLLKGLYDKGKDFVTQGIPNALRGESQFVVPRLDPFSSGADAMGGAFVGPTFNDQKINIQSLDSVFPTPPSEMSNEQFDKEFPFLPERTVNLDNLPFKAKPNVSNQYNLANARADNVGINLIGQLQNLQNLAQKYNLDKIQFDPFNPNSIGYKDQFMFNNTPVNYNIGIGDQGVEGGLSFVFKDGGSVDKYSGLGYKLR